MLRARPGSGSQMSVCPGFLKRRARPYALTITYVTRIREGVAAYYILTAHTGCLAWLV